jgi:hypothetical protein
MGDLSILNVGAGDTKITFDSKNPAEVIRTSRIIKDMLRRGYALLVEVERDGVKAYERALDFDEKTSEYIIADFDPVAAAIARKKEREAADAELAKPLSELVGPKEQESGESKPVEEAPRTEGAGAPKRGRGGRIPAAGARTVAVARSSGG